jgi:pilus assembly protein Flp/PilA
MGTTTRRNTKSDPNGPAALRRFMRDESGATAMEYGLMVALLSLAIIGTVKALGQSLNSAVFGQLVTSLASMSK